MTGAVASSRTRLTVATRNPGKLREFQALFADVAELVIVGLDNHAQTRTPDVVEDGDTFEANAVKKATEIARALGTLTLADDSGLEVDALEGRPGVHSARFAGAGATDADNNSKLVSELRALADAPRTARYRVVLALADPAGPLGASVHTEVGACAGRIQLEAHGTGGFGYDPHFVPDGFACTMAELTLDEKNRISHRAEAARKMQRFLASYLPRCRL